MSMSIIELKRKLEELRLSGASATLETRILESQSGNIPFPDSLGSLLQDESDRRHSRMIEKGFKRSGLPERASLIDFDWAYNPEVPKRACFELNTLKFIQEGLNAILVGHAGTGKSHVAKAIGYSAVREGLSVIYVEADDLLINLALAGADPQAKQKTLKPLLDADLLILDDLFLRRRIQGDPADELQGLLHRRYTLRRSVLLTTNRIVEDWGQCLGDAALSTAILDRLLHRGIPLNFRGRSYRLKQAAERLVNTEATE